MPTNRKRIARSRMTEDIPQWKFDYLMYGFNYGMPEQKTLEQIIFCRKRLEQEEIWEKHKEKLIKRFQKKNPGEMPYAYYKFDSDRFDKIYPYPMRFLSKGRQRLYAMNNDLSLDDPIFQLNK